MAVYSLAARSAGAVGARREMRSVQRCGSHHSNSPISTHLLADEVLRSPGLPLDPSSLTAREGRFSHDFGQVPVDTPVRASDSAAAIDASGGAVGDMEVSLPGDAAELEADRVADSVMAGTAVQGALRSSPRQASDRLLRMPGCTRLGEQSRRLRPVQRYPADYAAEKNAPAVVDEMLRSPGLPLGAATRAYMEPRFGHDFGRVRVHTDARAAESARTVNALAYTVGHDIAFGAAQYAPGTAGGRRLLAHELTHVIQQGVGDASIGVFQSSGLAIQRRAAPFIKKVTVHLAPPQTAELEWQGTPPADATGSDSFAVSTGKGYADPGDPRGTCTRTCCSDPMSQCAPPWNRPDRVGACCTYYGNDFWTGTPLDEHNGWKWWTPIQPWYSSRGIALHQHPDVTGQPIGHGCVRMDEPNARRIYDYSNGARTNVTIDGRAAPVACDDDRRCDTTAGARGELEAEPTVNMLADRAPEAVPGLEGVMT